MESKIDIIRKWYSKLEFSRRYDEELEQLLSRPIEKIQEGFSNNAPENFLSVLYKCEALEQVYLNKGIPLQVLYDTLSDIAIWTDLWYEMNGELGLMETEWLSHHLSFRLFRLGRLQFCMGHAERDSVIKGIRKGENVIEVHIPAGVPLQIEDCRLSIEYAKDFFAKYFPQYEYHFFTCHSWLLDESLNQFLGKDSNILAFQRLFEVEEAYCSDTILKYVFRWDAVRKNVFKYEARSKFAQNIKKHVLAGGVFYEAYGIFARDDI